LRPSAGFKITAVDQPNISLDPEILRETIRGLKNSFGTLSDEVYRIRGPEACHCEARKFL